jgi:hypothetical protein
MNQKSSLRKVPPCVSWALTANKMSAVRLFETDQAFREGRLWLIRDGAIDLATRDFI